MRRKRLLRIILPSFLLITLVSVTIAAWVSLSALRSFYVRQTSEDLQLRAQLLARELQPLVAAADQAAVSNLIRELGAESGDLITLIAANGVVLADSRTTADQVDNQLERPEVQEALAGEIATVVRFHSRIGEKMIFVAVPLRSGTEIVAILRVAATLTKVNEATNRLLRWFVLVAALAAVLATLSSYFVKRRVGRPLLEMKAAAESVTRGEGEGVLPESEYEEIGGLAKAINEMAQQTNEKFRTLQSQRLIQETIVSSMVEGVLVVDSEYRLMSCNRAAANLLNLDPSKAIGREILEIIRNTDLQRLVSRTYGANEPVEGDVIITDSGERYVQAHGTLLRDQRGEILGALIVLNDVTRLHKLENVRRDFVANVSHELKTPITSIKGFVETLLDGATLTPEESQRFLQIIARQADRLHSIIEDLLKLSRIEQEMDRGEIALAPTRIREPLQAAVVACEHLAKEKQITIRLQCDEHIQARMNAPLLEQAIVNLIQNAVKYSDPGTQVQVRVDVTDRTVLIAVQDEGVGIAREHLPRLFERFYRIDQARSRTQGGTGLGLAIVKHIVLSHGGTIQVESTPGKGSTFTISLSRV